MRACLRCSSTPKRTRATCTPSISSVTSGTRTQHTTAPADWLWRCASGRQIIVTELWLPHLDGYQLLAILKADSSTGATPVVVVTADATPDAVGRARAAGAELVFAKPCLPDFLFMASARVVAARLPPAVARARRRPLRARCRPGRTAHAEMPAMCARPPVPAIVRRRRRPSAGALGLLFCPGGCGRFCYRRRTRSMRRIG